MTINYCCICKAEVKSDLSDGCRVTVGGSWEYYCFKCGDKSKIKLQYDYDQLLSESRALINKNSQYKELLPLIGKINIKTLNDMAAYGLIYMYITGYISLTPIGQDLLDEMKRYKEID